MTDSDRERREAGLGWFLHRVKRRSPLLLGLLGLLTSSAPLTLAIAFAVRPDAPSAVRQAAFASPFPKKEDPSPAWDTHPIPAGSGLNFIVGERLKMEPINKPSFMPAMGQGFAGLAWNEVLGDARNLLSNGSGAFTVGPKSPSFRLAAVLAPAFARSFKSSVSVSFGSGLSGSGPGLPSLRPQGFSARVAAAGAIPGSLSGSAGRPFGRNGSAIGGPRPQAVSFSGPAEGHVSQAASRPGGAGARGILAPSPDNAAVRIEKGTEIPVARAAAETPCLDHLSCSRAGWTGYNRLATVDSAVVPAVGGNLESAEQPQIQQWDSGARNNKIVANADDAPRIARDVAPVTNQDSGGSPIAGDGNPPGTATPPGTSPVACRRYPGY